MSTDMNPARYECPVRLAVVGDIMLDRYWHGEGHRISPEAPVPVVRYLRQEDRIGGAGHVALNLAQLGATVALHALVGDDEAAQMLATLARAAGVTPHFHTVAAVPTVTKLRLLNRGQQLLRVDVEQHFPADAAGPLAEAYEACLAEADAVVLSDYRKGSLSNPQHYIQLAQQRGVPVLVDPKATEWAYYRGATVIKPNQHEFAAVVGGWCDDNDMVQRARTQIKTHNLGAVLVTQGAQGMTLITLDTVLHVAAKNQEVYDVTGAGDTVIAVLALALARGASLTSATVWANEAAGLVVRKLGTAGVTWLELEQALSEEGQEPTQRLSAMSAWVSLARARGERVAMVVGCFDPVHAGHLNFLERAYADADHLIVVVFSDQAVRARRLSQAVCLPLQQRLAILAEVDVVHNLLVCQQPDPSSLIHAVRPTVLVQSTTFEQSLVLPEGVDQRMITFFSPLETAL